MNKIDSRDLRRALSAFPTGIAVVTASALDGRRAGVTINSFTSVSLEPPLVLWSLSVRAPSRAIFEAATHFAIHVLAEGQRPIAERFCSSSADKFMGVVTGAGLGGAPLLEETAAVFECRMYDTHPGGDHVILIGEVERYTYAPTHPLVFHHGRYTAIVPGEGSAPVYAPPDLATWQEFYELEPETAPGR